MNVWNCSSDSDWDALVPLLVWARLAKCYVMDALSQRDPDSIVDEHRAVLVVLVAQRQQACEINWLVVMQAARGVWRASHKLKSCLVVETDSTESQAQV